MTTSIENNKDLLPKQGCRILGPTLFLRYSSCTVVKGDSFEIWLLSSLPRLDAFSLCSFSFWSSLVSTILLCELLLLCFMNSRSSIVAVAVVVEVGSGEKINPPATSGHRKGVPWYILPRILPDPNNAYQLALINIKKMKISKHIYMLVIVCASYRWCFRWTFTYWRSPFSVASCRAFAARALNWAWPAFMQSS